MKHIIIISDLHINSTVALCKPLVELDDGGNYQLSKSQRWLWEKWNNFLDTIGKLDGEKIVILNGDLVEGDTKDRSFQLVTRNPASIVQHAVDILEPVRKMCSKMFIVRGTASHTGKSGSYEELIANDLECEKDKDSGTYSWWNLPIVVEKVSVDISHHNSGSYNGRREAALRLARNTILEYANNYDEIPNILVRSHTHLHYDTQDSYRTRVIITPAWSLATEYINKLNPNSISDVGGCVISCSSGKYSVNNIIYKSQRRKFIKV